MKNGKAAKVKITGRLDSMTDELKQTLSHDGSQPVSELIPKIRRRLATNQSVTKFEKNLLRCLQKNPAFVEDQRGYWTLQNSGERKNDVFYQAVAKARKPVRLSEAKEKAGAVCAGIFEPDLVHDGRFVRLKDGRWALINWEIHYQVSSQDLQRVFQLLNAAKDPVSAQDLAKKVLRGGIEGTDILERMSKDKRFAWVGGNRWTLKERIPVFSPPPALEEQPFASLRQVEQAVLQEAELMLVLNDTDPVSRPMILSSSDLALGRIRVSKRLEKVLAGVPSIAFITLDTVQGKWGGWYFFHHKAIYGFKQWYEIMRLAPGNKVNIHLLDGPDLILEIRYKGEREPEVFAEGQRVLSLEALKNEVQGRRFSLEELIQSVLQLFPLGLSEGALGEILAGIQPFEIAALRPNLSRYPFFEEVAPETWRFNGTMKQAYDNMQRELQDAKVQLTQSEEQIAAAVEATRSLLGDKEGMLEELERLQRHHRVEEENWQRKVEKIEADKARMVEEKVKTEELARQLEQAKSQTERTIQKLEERLIALQAERDTLRRKLEHLEGRVIQLQASLGKVVNETQSEQLDLNQRLKELENQLERTMLANRGLQQTVTELQDERRELRRQLAPWPVRMALVLSRPFMRGSRKTANEVRVVSTFNGRRRSGRRARSL